MNCFQNVKRFLKIREVFSLIVVVVLFLIVGLVNPDFLQKRNLMQTINSSVVFGLLSIGISFVLIIGEIDVSIGAVMGLTAAISATMIRDGSPVFLAVIVAICVGALCGLFNGIGLMYLKIPSIIITLGTNGIIRGLIYVYTNGKWVENVPYDYKALSQITCGGITLFYWGTILVALLGTFFLKKVPRGRNYAAVGDNVGGATLIGIPIYFTKISAFVLSSVFASIAGLIYVSRIGFVTPIAGNGYEMKAIAACVLGGISLSGGVGSLVGAMIGAIIMASIDRILVFLKFSSDFDGTITGILLITIVAVDALLQHHAIEKSRRMRLLAKTAQEDK
ncbi:MAG: ABC transporter permease [Treponema sp.]|nr:ABC transporter permease [Treponema sp.]